MSGAAARKHLLIGLTGGIGSGKSTVAALFEKLGARIIDTDALSRQLTRPGGGAIAAIRAAFGSAYLDVGGALDRNKMRALIFADPSEKKRLEAILHPAILAHAQQLAASATDAPYTLVVIPLLFETGNYRTWLDRTLTVDCAEAAQVARTMQRSGLDQAGVQAIMAQQTARAQRLALSDDVIRNDGDLAALTGQVAQLHGRYKAIAGGSD
ncbi:MAG: dephospho-CoA kinase [Gallionellaceae bacterium]|nr:MAG: dephospho-CoA kinase [Gallionellaceae bacterium]